MLMNFFRPRTVRDFKVNCNTNMQGDSLPDQQTLRGDSRHEDKHYLIGNHGAQTFFVGAKGH